MQRGDDEHDGGQGDEHVRADLHFVGVNTSAWGGKVVVDTNILVHA